MDEVTSEKKLNRPFYSICVCNEGTAVRHLEFQCQTLAKMLMHSKSAKVEA